ncbi:MAG: acyltransferase [Gammaproteobacteria bacterium]|nr:acyltransferase [Gammaproteobacteria bacterium]
MRSALRLLLVLLPWALRRPLLCWLYGYRLHPRSRIGVAWIYPRHLSMEQGASIGHLTVIKGLDCVSLGAHASIGRLNWITAYPRGAGRHFTHLTERQPVLQLGEHAAITHRHIIDCTERVRIGRFSTVAGYRSQILTHSVDLRECRQDAHPVEIGEYCFVSTACILLGGSGLPDHSVLGANALLNEVHQQPWRLYAGIPARPVAQLDPAAKYFTRARGFIL